MAARVGAMDDIIILSIVGGGAIGWAFASLRRMQNHQPLFRFEAISSALMTVAGATLLTRAMLAAQTV